MGSEASVYPQGEDRLFHPRQDQHTRPASRRCVNLPRPGLGDFWRLPRATTPLPESFSLPSPPVVNTFICESDSNGIPMCLEERRTWKPILPKPSPGPLSEGGRQSIHTTGLFRASVQAALGPPHVLFVLFTSQEDRAQTQAQEGTWTRPEVAPRVDLATMGGGPERSRVGCSPPSRDAKIHSSEVTG